MFLFSFTAAFWDLTHRRAACVSQHPAMEPWPIVAWFLMLTFIADWIETVWSRDFTKKDIIFLHPSSKYLKLQVFTPPVSELNLMDFKAQ